MDVLGRVCAIDINMLDREISYRLVDFECLSYKMASIDWHKWKFEENGSVTDLGIVKSNDYYFTFKSPSPVITLEDQAVVAGAVGAGIPIHLRSLYGNSVELVRHALFGNDYTPEDKKNFESKLSPANLAAYQAGLEQVTAWYKANHKEDTKLRLKVPLCVTWDPQKGVWQIVATMWWEPTIEAGFRKLSLDESKKADCG